MQLMNICPRDLKAHSPNGNQALPLGVSRKAWRLIPAFPKTTYFFPKNHIRQVTKFAHMYLNVRIDKSVGWLVYSMGFVNKTFWDWEARSHETKNKPSTQDSFRFEWEMCKLNSVHSTSIVVILNSSVETWWIKWSVMGWWDSPAS